MTRPAVRRAVGFYFFKKIDTQTVKILIIDKYTLLRSGVKTLISESHKLCLFHEAVSLQAAKPILASQVLDLVITDINVTDEPYLNIVNAVRHKNRHTPILIYSAFPEVTFAMPMLRVGANGFLSKEAPIEEMKRAVETILAGKKYLSPELQSQLITETISAAGKPQINPLSKLSEREKLIMALVLEGKGTSEIAYALDLKSNTVSTFKKRLFQKMGVDNHMELTAKASAVSSMHQAGLYLAGKHQ